MRLILALFLALLPGAGYALDVPATIHVDTDYLIQGPPGPVGPAGPMGPQGIQGPPGSGSGKPEIWVSQKDGELVPKLFLTTGGCAGFPTCNFKPKAIYRLNIGPVEVGDIIQAEAEAEFTNDNSYVVSVVSAIALSPLATYGDAAIDPYGSPYVALSEKSGNNVDRSIVHHDVHTKHGAVKITPAMKAVLGSGDVYAVFYAWTVSTAANTAHFVTVDKGYGRLNVLRWR